MDAVTVSHMGTHYPLYLLRHFCSQVYEEPTGTRDEASPVCVQRSHCCPLRLPNERSELRDYFFKRGGC